jgi:hypothetical protein
MLAEAASWELVSENTLGTTRYQMLDTSLPTKLMARNHPKLWKGDCSATISRLTISKSREYRAMFHKCAIPNVGMQRPLLPRIAVHVALVRSEEHRAVGMEVK